MRGFEFVCAGCVVALGSPMSAQAASDAIEESVREGNSSSFGALSAPKCGPICSAHPRLFERRRSSPCLSARGFIRSKPSVRRADCCRHARQANFGCDSTKSRRSRCPPTHAGCGSDGKRAFEGKRSWKRPGPRMALSTVTVCALEGSAVGATASALAVIHVGDGTIVDAAIAVAPRNPCCASQVG